MFGGSDDSGPLAGILPTGRAPRGKGQEYADRRAIVSRIETQAGYRAQLQGKLDRYRGQKNARRDITYSRFRVIELDKAITAATGIAQGPGEWGFKRELINGVFDYLSTTTDVR